jgi:hypothetical protein
LIPNVGLHIKLKLLKIAIRCGNFKTSAKRKIFKNYKNNCHSAKKWLIIGSFQKRSILPPQRKFLPSGGGVEKKLFLIIVNVLGHPKGVGGLTSYFLRGGGMDVFWNDPLSIIFVVFEYFPFSY